MRAWEVRIAGKPNAGFIEAIKNAAEVSQVNLLGLLVTDGNECRNMLFIFEDKNNPGSFVEAFCEQLMHHSIPSNYGEMLMGFAPYIGVFEDRSSPLLSNRGGS